MAKEVWTPLKILKWTVDYFTKAGVDEPRLDAELLLAKALGIERIMLYAGFERVLGEDELARFRGYVKERAAGRPAKYITGVAEFYSLVFEVDERVLIPRPETELLVERALSYLKEESGVERPTVVEIGTGSGAVAVSLAKNFPAVRYVATDISAGALEVAKANAEANDISAEIEFVEGDLFGPLENMGLGRAVDLVVSNPPYVRESEVSTLPKEIADYEPLGALVAGPLGTEVHERILRGAADCLRRGGVLLMEMDNSQRTALEEMTARLDSYELPRMHQDFARLWRVIEVRRA